MLVSQCRNILMSSLLRSFTTHPTLALVKPCQTLQQVQQIHAQVIVQGLLHDDLLLGKFVAAIALSNPKNGPYSDHILNQCQSLTVLTLNTLIRAYSRSPWPEKCFFFYSRILHSAGLFPDNYTFTFLVRSCVHESTCRAAYVVHAAVISQGFGTDQHVQSGLIHVYAHLGDLKMVERVYNGIRNPDLVTQTAALSAVAGAGNTLLAQTLFDGMPQRDLVAWNAIIAGYSQQGKPREALKMFDFMLREGVEGDEGTLVSVLSACSQLGALKWGDWVASYIQKRKMRMTVMLGTALLDLYCKCGEVNIAIDIFWKMKERNVFTWSTMLGGLAVHGAGVMCLEYFDLMKKEGVVLNEVTFVSIIRGCSMAGLVEEGEKHFDSMAKIYGLKATHEHYGCMVDLYGRAGRMDDAVRFINNMPIRTHTGAWVALLNACRIHKQIDLGKWAFQKIIELDPNFDGAYVLLSNIYADFRDWDQVVDIRKKMRTACIRKEPGHCAIEVGGEILKSMNSCRGNRPPKI